MKCVLWVQSPPCLIEAGSPPSHSLRAAAGHSFIFRYCAPITRAAPRRRFSRPRKVTAARSSSYHDVDKWACLVYTGGDLTKAFWLNRAEDPRSIPLPPAGVRVHNSMDFSNPADEVVCLELKQFQTILLIESQYLFIYLLGSLPLHLWKDKTFFFIILHLNSGLPWPHCAIHQHGNWDLTIQHFPFKSQNSWNGIELYQIKIPSQVK